MKNEKIKNIIFDLGDVILNIDVLIASRSFAELSGKEQSEILTIFQENDIFRGVILSLQKMTNSLLKTR